jgi:hypothetical protein
MSAIVDFRCLQVKCPRRWNCKRTEVNAFWGCTLKTVWGRTLIWPIVLGFVWETHRLSLLKHVRCTLYNHGFGEKSVISLERALSVWMDAVHWNSSVKAVSDKNAWLGFCVCSLNILADWIYWYDRTGNVTLGRVRVTIVTVETE